MILNSRSIKTETPSPDSEFMTTHKTQERILDVAERHFARRGYYGASLRSITTEAGVQLALVHYHFKSKEKLYRAVFARRVNALTERRLGMLAEGAAGKRGRPTLEQVVRALVAPTLELCSSEEGGRHYGQMLGPLINDPEDRARDILTELFDPVARRFITAIRQAAPELDVAAAHWGYYFAIGAMVQALAKTGRIERLSDSRCDSGDVEIVIDSLVQFITAGLNALAPAARKPRSAKREISKRDAKKKSRMRVAALSSSRSVARSPSGGTTT
jgi:AcrR family transcriptional regulator